ncbi:Rab geranylgeranyltransferase, beta subunit, putative [Babesia bigemina]|uniref:Geranylgeranyl transferase type II subunit beta n=1 Tax=Babesia bigemina TaxID=5866 RepID=A0A061DDW8_BABBI|nr:Rab geranylgeranyltransferase, beta subunit, putative [Babesia bigemina]CDR97754.1 Rab geranylgeranyltransferase, beta subunit, putative [Babesia bigemina]|eukprot:XP_012769940.1 Rab geranylgeranyltransferase, beta subunit, putative [Babesia bigemina]
MEDARKEKILKGIHAYFNAFYKHGLSLLGDTEVMPLDVQETRAHHEQELLKGMYWALFSLHLLYNRYNMATKEQLEHNRAQAERESEQSDAEDSDLDMSTYHYPPIDFTEPPDEDEDDAPARDVNASDLAAALNEMQLLRTSNRVLGGPELDTSILKGKEVDMVLRFLKVCQREFVYDDYMFLGFANSDDRRRFTANVTSTLMAINTYRVIGDNLRTKSSISFLKHMSWMYQWEEILSFFSLLYVKNEGYYRKCVMPQTAHCSDIRHTASAVLSTSMILRVCQHATPNSMRSVEGWVNVEEVTAHVLKHFNDDGGVGLSPGAESHCGAAFCALLILTILGKIKVIDRNLLVGLRNWLVKRLANFGGVSGRIGKCEDMCYSFWMLAALDLLNKCGVHSQILRGREMIRFIEKCQTPGGGIAPYPCEPGVTPQPDPYHTFAALMTIAFIEEENQQTDMPLLQMLI